jgi:hypothetical protein
MNKYLLKGLVLGIIFLFLNVSIITSICARSDNDADLLESKSFSADKGEYFIIGFLKVVSKHEDNPGNWSIMWNTNFFGIIIGFEDSPDPLASPFVFEFLSKNSNIQTWGVDYNESKLLVIYPCHLFIIP